MPYPMKPVQTLTRPGPVILNGKTEQGGTAVFTTDQGDFHGSNGEDHRVLTDLAPARQVSALVFASR